MTDGRNTGIKRDRTKYGRLKHITSYVTQRTRSQGQWKGP